MDFFEESSPTAPTPQQEASADPRGILNERGADSVATQEAAIEERLAEDQAKRQEKDTAVKEAARTFLEKAISERSEHITADKEQHRESQAASEKLRDELQSKGALWPSVLMLVDTSKPNNLSKRGTELMRSTFVELQNRKEISE